MAKPVASYLPPRGPLNATLITWECGREMHRVHDDASGAGWRDDRARHVAGSLAVSGLEVHGDSRMAGA